MSDTTLAAALGGSAPRRVALPCGSLAALLLAVAVLGLPRGSRAEPHPFTATDLQSMERISDPRLSPQGDRVAFVLRTSDFAANKGRTDLWLARMDGGAPTRLTADPAADTEPVWSPDGRTLYFLSSRSGLSQVWRLVPGDGGQAPGGAVPAAERVLDLPLDVSNLIVTPDGASLLFSLDVFPDCPDLRCTRDRLDRMEKGPVKAHLFPDGGGFVRHWDTWEDGTRSHLFIARVPAAGSAPATAEPIDLTRGMLADIPSKPFGGTEEIAVSPDSRQVVFTARAGGRTEPWSTNFDLYAVPADGSRPPADLTAANKAWDTYPAFSPDGRTLAYAAATRPGFEADRLRIHLRDLASGGERVLAEAWDRSAGPLAFSADGRTLYTTADDVGQTPLFAIDVRSGAVRKVVAEGHVDSFAVGADRLVVNLDNLRLPGELFTVRPDGAGLTQITHVNRDRLAAVEMGEPEQFQFQGAGGDTVYGWVVKPARFDAGQKYPLAFLIHGGPQGSFNNHFHYRWNPQPYAGAGYAVVMIDFHGSTGYGQAFTDAISGDWGGKPLVDLQRGLAAALARYPWIDGDRACALGASYGGFMTNWIAGNWPDRFRCLVTHDGVFDQRMMYYATEELWFPEWEHGGPYWQSPEQHEKDNPARFVDRWRTPMLVIHGSLDYRIPITQGLAAFTVLQRRAIPSEFLHFPDENHWVLKPANSLLWHDTVLAWLDRWLKGARR